MKKARRNILKTIVSTAFIITAWPFVSLGSRFFYRRERKIEEVLKQKVININELQPNSSYNFTFPKTGDPKVDNDPFRQYVLIKSPSGDVRALSRVCVHLWCLWTYFPNIGAGVCPCHGSVYNPDTGVAIKGPAYYQPYPTNCLPMLKVDIDDNGDVYVSQLDGRVGYGREWKKDLKPLEELAAMNPDAEVLAYVPLWRPISVMQAIGLLKQYELNLIRAYGYAARNGDREWLTADKVQDMQNMIDAVYSLDVRARPPNLLRLASDDKVIIPLLREKTKKFMKEFRIEALDFGYNGYKGGPTLRVKEGDTVKIWLINRGGVEHELIVVRKEDYELYISSLQAGRQIDIKPAFSGSAIHKIKPGEVATAEFKVDKKGEYLYVCLVEVPALHAKLGMQGLFIVE